MSWTNNMMAYNHWQMTGKFLRFCCCCLALLILAGCQTTKVDKWKPVRSQHKNQVHTVTWAGENLQVVAKWYTGTENNWKEIANANPNILPSKLSAGDRILIPTALLKTRATMTKTFLDDWLYSAKMKAMPAAVPKNGEQAPLIVPKLHKLKPEGEDHAGQEAPVDITKPEDDSNDLELFGPK